MKTLELTHANLNQPIHVLPAQLFGFYWSESAKATLLLSSGTAVIPVKESVDEVEMQVKRLQEQGINGGILYNTQSPTAFSPIPNVGST